MLVGERELYRRFSSYDDEELLRILTVERAQYRGEALAAAELVLTQRGVPPPMFFATPGPAAVAAAPATPGGATRPKSPYHFFHFAFDVVLFALVCWALGKLWAWTIADMGGLWGQVAFYVMAGHLLASAAALRSKWRAVKW